MCVLQMCVLQMCEAREEERVRKNNLNVIVKETVTFQKTLLKQMIACGNHFSSLLLTILIVVTKGYNVHLYHIALAYHRCSFQWSKGLFWLGNL